MSDIVSVVRRGSVRRIGFGIALWAIPYALSIPLLPLRESDPLIFKAILLVLGAALSSFLAVLYFRSIAGDYLQESIVLAATWVIVNWLLDFAGILPFAHLTLGRYFLEIGLAYIGFVAPIVAMGYLLDVKTGARPATVDGLHPKVRSR